MAKIAVVGCGAMGSVYAALMVDAGHEVHAVTLWPDHAEEFANLLKSYSISSVTGDRYAGQWCAQAFQSAASRTRRPKCRSPAYIWISYRS